MVIKLLNEKEYKAVYKLYAPQDFSATELKPLSMMMYLRRNGMAEAYGLVAEEGLVAYAYFIKRPQSNAMLLDYFAVCGTKNCGYGTALLKSINKYFEERAYILAEVASPDSAFSEKEQSLRHRRKKFYVTNGWDPTDYKSNVFGHEYDILLLPLAEIPSDQDAAAELGEIYRLINPNAYKRGKMKIQCANAEDSQQANVSTATPPEQGS